MGSSPQQELDFRRPPVGPLSLALERAQVCPSSHLLRVRVCPCRTRQSPPRGPDRSCDDVSIVKGMTALAAVSGRRSCSTSRRLRLPSPFVPTALCGRLVCDRFPPFFRLPWPTKLDYPPPKPPASPITRLSFPPPLLCSSISRAHGPPKGAACRNPRVRSQPRPFPAPLAGA